jgi:hypothetical protein
MKVKNIDKSITANVDNLVASSFDYVVGKRVMEKKLPKFKRNAKKTAYLKKSCSESEFPKKNLTKVKEKNNVSCRLNRFWQLCIMIVYAGCVGCHFFNWVSWEVIFSQNFPNTNDCLTETSSSKQQPECIEFTKRTDRMFVIYQASMYSCSFFAGVAFDIVGPKLCSILGISLLISGWFIFFLNLSKSPMYEIAMALIGSGTDAAFLGTLNTHNLFPKHKTFVIALLRAARSLSNIFPFLLRQLALLWPKTFNLVGISIFFIILYVYCLVIAFFFVPSNMEEAVTSEKIADSEDSLSVQKPTKDVESAFLCHADSHPICNDYKVDTKEMSPLTVSNQVLSEKRNTEAESNGKIVDPYYQKDILITISYVNAIHFKWKKFCRLMQTFSQKSLDCICIFLRELNILKKHLMSANYLPIVLIAISNVLRNSFYLLSAKHRLGTSKKVLEIASALLFIPGCVCGYFSNGSRLFTVMITINLFMIIAFVCTIIANSISNHLGSSILLYTSILFSHPSSGFAISQAYCYVTLVFDSSDLGKLAGFASFAGGVAGFLSDFMNNTGRNSFSFLVKDIIAIVISLATLGLILLLKWQYSTRCHSNDTVKYMTHNKNKQ